MPAATQSKWSTRRATSPAIDQGGLVYQPTVGLHRDVAEVDFISMYPSVMVHFNISPETIGPNVPEASLVPQLNMYIDQQHPGLVPRTLEPLLKKRIAMKYAQATLPKWDPRVKRYKMCSQAHKWLLVTCFGYLGYKNARFGRIEAHQAVTAYGREILIEAKEAAEDQDFEVLHMYVDGLWIRKPGAKVPADFQDVLNSINLARNNDALFIRSTPGTTPPELDAASAEALYTETELGLRARECTSTNAELCTKAALRPSLPPISSASDYLLYRYYRVIPIPS